MRPVKPDNFGEPGIPPRLKDWRRQTLKICLPNGPRVALIHCLAVEFDDVAVGVDYINLRVAC
jgi:hypothetical protein